MESLHQAAFRNTLSNSIYCPPHNVSALTNLDVSVTVVYVCIHVVMSIQYSLVESPTSLTASIEKFRCTVTIYFHDSQIRPTQLINRSQLLM